MALTIRALTPEWTDAWLAFFDGPAFADNPGWSGCYCRCFLFGGGGFDAFDAACASGENRAAMEPKLRAGEVDGLLAFEGEQAVGWVHLGPAQRFHTPLCEVQPQNEGEAFIVCFVVAPTHRKARSRRRGPKGIVARRSRAGFRRQGEARALLRQAVTHLTERGFASVVARAAADREAPAMEQFTGPAALYLSEGFAEVERQDRRVLVRRVLGS
ncbi:MAG: hypothetical protein KTR31_32255 [Myxococcales bacterium]|nr:hypothetical protein [Myxococcales bacterium]